ncbi:MAG: hypothetical protein KAF64_16340 [Hydrogenophaga sp.]|uniref:hypothetical protein n=1 Tax=Hydrogenophaga sp. TaxID=1904254 RepID=UPI0025BFAA07|nr:hypothetical protein [Hydrogenophaga sp.]MBU7574928.1 hypothetical protein [Hydrogenophaga sp.]
MSSSQLLPSSIQKIEEKEFDGYIGKAEDLMAAGLVRPEQFPPEGKRSVSYLGGVVMPRRCRMDETYLRVCRRDDADMPWLVCVGLPRGELLQRRAKAREKRRRERAQSVARCKAELAQRELARMPGSERQFVCEVAATIRELADLVFLRRLDQAKGGHGYRFSTETKESALTAVDAIVEALVQGEVIFDAERHAQIVEAHRAVIRAADPAFYAQLDKLTTPDASILAGEAP